MSGIILGVVGVFHHGCFINCRSISGVGKLPFDISINILGILDNIIDPIEDAEIENVKVYRVLKID